MKKVICIMIFLAMLTGCASKPWEKFPMGENPDRSCWSGSEAGYEVYLWDCYRNEHIVIYQWQSGLYTFSSKKEKSACGVKTEFEKKYVIAKHPKGICRKDAAPWIVESGLSK